MQKYLEKLNEEMMIGLKKLMVELGKETNAKQQHLIEMMCEKYLTEVHVMKINKKILAYRKNKSLDDIFLNFMDSEALSRRIITLKKRGPEKPNMILLVDRERQTLVSALFIIEYIFGEYLCLEFAQQDLYRLIYKKILCEMKILNLDEELMKESIEEADVLDKIVKKVLNTISHYDS